MNLYEIINISVNISGPLFIFALLSLILVFVGFMSSIKRRSDTKSDRFESKANVLSVLCNIYIPVDDRGKKLKEVNISEVSHKLSKFITFARWNLCFLFIEHGGSVYLNVYRTPMHPEGLNKSKPLEPNHIHLWTIC